MIAGIAESHRLPFDLPEAEHELVAGFHTEYSGMKFGLIMVGEYLSVILTSAMIVTLFFGGWLGPAFLPPIVWFTLKTATAICFFVLLRAAIPRPRYDQLMSLGVPGAATGTKIQKLAHQSGVMNLVSVSVLNLDHAAASAAIA